MSKNMKGLGSIILGTLDVQVGLLGLNVRGFDQGFWKVDPQKVEHGSVMNLALSSHGFGLAER